MKIQRNREKRLWELSSGARLLYQGRRSPWDHPEIIREALRAEHSLAPGRTRGDEARPAL